MSVTISDVVGFLDSQYPKQWAADWDAVGKVCGRADSRVSTVLFAVDCVNETVEEAHTCGAQLMVTHHPLMLRGVTNVSPSNYKGAIIHSLIESHIGLYVAHTNADAASPGVSDALAETLGLTSLRALMPDEDDESRGIGRIGQLPQALSLAQFTQHVADHLPATAWGVRATGDPAATVSTVAVCGGAGDSYLPAAVDAAVDAFVTADLRHHPASEHIQTAGPALIDAAHWATERPWLDMVAAKVREAFDVDTVVSDLNTDPWTLHASST